MSPDVKNWLLNVASSEVFGLYDFADSVLLRLGYTKAEAVGLLAFNDGFSTTAEMLDRLRDLYASGCREVIAAHGIQSRSTDLRRLSQVVYGLRLLSDTEDTAQIEDSISRCDGDYRLVMSELLAWVAGGDWTIYYSELDYVSSDLIDRLRERATQTSLESYVDPNIAQQMKAFNAAYPQSLMQIAVSEDGAAPGIPIETLFSNYKADLQRLCPDNPQRYAIEAYGLCVLAGIPDEHKQKIAMDLAQNYTKNIAFCSLLSSYITRLIQEFKRGQV